MAVDNKLTTGLRSFWDNGNEVLNVAPNGSLPVQTYIESLEDRVAQLEARIKQLEEAYMEQTLLGQKET
jgi:hypothetical protein